MELMKDQEALSFLTQQAAHIESTVYKTKYEDIQYPDLISVDTSAGEWAKSIEFYSMDQGGKARWFNHSGDDVPLVNTNMQKHTHNIEMAAVGYEYTNQELGYAQRMGQNITADRAAAVRRAYEEFVDDLVKVGDAEKGMEGMLDSSLVTATASAGAWSGLTADQIVDDINTPLTAVYAGSKRVEMANTILLPVERFSFLATTRMGVGDGSLTILEHIRKANVYTATTGQELSIRAVSNLIDAGAGDTTRMVAYRNAPEVLKLHAPVPLRFLEPMRKGPMHYQVPAYFRVGGVEVRLPNAMRYVDGI